jgi:putative transcriptional regulator
MTKTYKDDISAAIHETASDLYEIGLLPKSTMREIDELCLEPVHKLSSGEIKSIREQAHASQAVFARYLNVTAGLVSQWERGEKSPSGPALKLLSIVQKKGLDALA